jgi:hypothetical protein
MASGKRQVAGGKWHGARGKITNYGVIQELKIVLYKST